MKPITASLVGMYHICKRELWLHAHQINMEQTSDTVAEGKLIGQTTYPQRAARYTEVALDWEPPGGPVLRGKIDFFDAQDRLVHEIKKSDKLDHAHVAQVKFYLYLLAKNGLEGCAGLLEYPKLRQTQRVEPLDAADTAEVEGWLADIATILALPRCPPLVKKRYCKTCSYHDFCYAE
jgi:CRISPR-associated exonuclease Cas4